MKSVAPVAAVLVIAVMVHTLLVPLIGPFYGKVIVDIGINAMLAVSLNIVNGFTGQFSIGHAGFMAIGGYVGAIVTYYGSFAVWGSAAEQGGAGQALFIVGCLAGGLIAAAFGYIVGLPSLRLRGDYLAIVTLGFGEILRVMLQRSDDVLTDAVAVREALPFAVITKVGGALGFTGVPFYTTPLAVYVFCGLTVLVAYRLKESTYGRAFLSIRENELAAEAMGVHTTRLKVRAFVLAAFFAGIAGVLYANEVGVTLTPRELGFQKSFDIVIMVVLGGMGSISGSVIAAAFLTILPEALRSFAEYRLIVYALLLIVVMLSRPQGLFGVRELWDLRKRRGAAT